MKHLFIFIVILTITLFSPKHIVAVEEPVVSPNNVFGIHILFPGELETATKLVNSNGGDWGYVTIPIQSTDRNLEKWQQFMDDCRRLHIIPIIRIATYPQGNLWTRPTIFDHLDFANFLNSLSWPTKNRYIIVYNEPNSNLEWGGAVDAPHYAQELSNTIDAFKRVSSDFFVISAGLDSHAPNRGDLYKNSYSFLLEMEKAVPGIFLRIDGFASHSYPNSNFTANPQRESRGGIVAFRGEVAFLKRQFDRDNIPIFITETGWEQSKISEAQAASFYTYAFEHVWEDANIVAITPFLLNGQGSAFSGFSMLRPDGSPSKIFETIALLPKNKGKPQFTSYHTPQIAQGFSLGVKNFREADAQLPILAMSAPLRAFLKWLFY